MSPDRDRPHPRRSGVDHEEERAWIGFYKRVGHDPAIAAEVMAQLETDADIKRTHLALYLCCKKTLRLHKQRQARNRRLGQFLRWLADLLLHRPATAVGTYLRRTADLAMECLPGTRREPASRQAQRLTKDPEFAAARADFERGNSPASATQTTHPKSTARSPSKAAAM